MYRTGRVLYESPMAGEVDVEGFRLEGRAGVSFPQGRLRMENLLDPAEGQRANSVLWCPEELPAEVAISWAFRPGREPGLCILFFAARGRGGVDLFDPSLRQREGINSQYHHGDIDACQVSYFRRRTPETRSFHVCNLRKSHGFHMVAQGADPLPDVRDAAPPYTARVIVLGADVAFTINDLPILHFRDDGQTYGPPLDGGKVGFRQMAPLVAQYANLTVHEALSADGA